MARLVNGIRTSGIVRFLIMVREACVVGWPAAMQRNNPRSVDSNCVLALRLWILLRFAGRWFRPAVSGDGWGRFQFCRIGPFSGRQLLREQSMAQKNTVRVVTRGADGTLRIRDYPTTETLLETHTQIGIDDCSTDLALRGLPVFRGLIGPMPEGKQVIRYESPDVFESLTKEWSSSKSSRKPRRRTQPPADREQVPHADELS